MNFYAMFIGWIPLSMVGLLVFGILWSETRGNKIWPKIGFWSSIGMGVVAVTMAGLLS